MTTKSGCTKCCGIILADTEDWENPLCHAHWVAIGSPEVEPKSEAREFWIYDHDRGRGNPDLVVHLAKKIYTSKHPPHETHVIEMKAYTDLKAKHERVLQMLDRMLAWAITTDPTVGMKFAKELLVETKDKS